jgi:ACS family hexuronate transporter-like MFS transporter
MGSYSLWSNWTPLYLANVYHLQLKDVARYAWIPPLVSNVGGFFGGWLSYRLIRRAVSAAEARRRAVWISSGCALSALFLPWAPSASWATVCISAGYFVSLAGSVNLYALPIDLFGVKRTGLALSALTCAFGIMQAILSPLIGALADHHAYGAVVPVVTVPLLLSAAVLGALRLDQPASER